MIYASDESLRAVSRDQKLGEGGKAFVAGEAHGVLQGLWRDWVTSLARAWSERLLVFTNLHLHVGRCLDHDGIGVGGLVKVYLVVLRGLCVLSDTQL